MAIFTAIAAAVVGGLTGAGFAAAFAAAGTFSAIGIATSVLAGTLAITASSLYAKKMAASAGRGTGGGRVQLPPATDNKIPVIYGTAFAGGPVMDAKISSDLKTMWYVVALAEVTDTTAGSGYTFDLSNIYYDNKRVQFGFNGVVTGLITNTPSQTEIDTKMSGKIYIWLYDNGSNSPVNTSQTAIQVLSDPRIPVYQRWTATDTMTNCAFAVVRVDYDQKAGTVGLGGLMCKITNSLSSPGAVIKDYMLNTRYGCAIPLSRIDTDSLDALDEYSNEQIPYEYESVAYTQNRYTINGTVSTQNNCLTNLQELVDSCDSWLQYSELVAKWKVVMNNPYDWVPSGDPPVTIDDLFLVDSSNLVGGVQIAPINLNETYNLLEVAYPNNSIKDQTDYQIIELADYIPEVMSPNEAINKLDVDLPLVNNAVQAKYLGIRRLLQSREDLTVTFQLDYSGIQIEAGDVIRVKHEEYGWDVLNGGKGKLFRVASVNEEKYPDGSLGTTIAALEYNGTIYSDFAIEDFRPDPNTGLTDPNIIYAPSQPTVVQNPDSAGVVTSFNVTSAVPEVGAVLYMDINYGNTSNTELHRLYRTISSAAGTKFENSIDIANSIGLNNVIIDINDIPAGNYYFSVVARNDFGGNTSNVSNLFFWVGAGINTANIIDGNGVFSNGNILTSNNAISNISVGANVYLTGGTGELANNTYIVSVNSTTPTANFVVTPTPVIPLANATIQVIRGGINGNAIVPNTMPGNRVSPNTLPGNTIIGNTVNGNVIIANTLNGNAILTNTANGNIIINGTVTNVQIAIDTIISNNIRANAITAGKIAADAVTANTIAANSIIAGKIAVDAVTANTIAANSVVAGKIAADAVTANSIAANAVIAGKIAAGAVTAGTIDVGAVTANTIAANAITSNTIQANAITAGKIDANAVTAGTIAAGAVTSNTIAANAITANTIQANAITAGKIDANAVTAGTIAVGAVTANTIAANAITSNTIQANAITSDKIAANSITSDKIAANSITSVMIQANTVTTEQLVIGSVTQARSTIQSATVEPVPFTNVGNAWPDNTRCIVPAGGVTIIPTTDPNTSANIEFQEGSRIQVGFTVKFYVEPTASNWDQYNCIELWKSGASQGFDRGFNSVQHSYNDSTFGRTQTIHAIGYGLVDLYSSDGGNTWGTYSSIAPEDLTYTGMVTIALGSQLANTIAPTVGYLQQNPAVCASTRQGNTGSASQLRLEQNLPYLSTTSLKLDMAGLVMAPGTGGNGPGANRELLGPAENGSIFWSPSGDFSTTANTQEGVSGLYKSYNSIYAGSANGTQYTAIAVGQTGTIVRATRTLNTNGTWSARPTYIGGNTSANLLSDLYGVASDDSVQSATSKWVAVGQYGMIQYSLDDGDSWTQVTSPVESALNAVRYGNGTWVAVGDDGVIVKNSGNIALANNWTQVDTSNLSWNNGASYGNIYDRDLVAIDYTSTYDKFNIGGTALLLNTGSANITPVLTYQQDPSEVYDLTRMTYFGSGPNVQSVALPSAQNRVLNSQVFSYSVIDSDYEQGQETTYYLVVGNLAGRQVYVGQAYIQVQEIKR